MRCIGCFQDQSLFQFWLDANISRANYLCEQCYMKHPILIEYSVIPNRYHHIFIIHAAYDGHYPSYAYQYIDIKVIDWFQTHGRQGILIIEDEIEVELIQMFTELDVPILIVNFENKKKRSDGYVI